MKIIFIRHAKTLGNLDEKYIGSTDEPLCKAGINELKQYKYPAADCVISSSMKRCIQTAALIYPQQTYFIYENLRECDFGDFEEKSYAELNGNTDYQQWLNSGGKIPFPNGEAREDFSLRCCNAFEKAVNDNKTYESLAFVVHGGTIMSVLEKYANPRGGYYDFQVKNCCGYVTECDVEALKIKIISEIK